MATTTNYGWTTPDDTDLVKDGAAAIRTLGSSVDTTTKALNPSTTLGDIEYRSATANTNTRLPIGSAGQVLGVSGGVPAWVTSADQTPLTTKGDLFTFTTVDARIGVGANDTVLTADSTTATGLKWAAPVSGGMTVLASGSLPTGTNILTLSSISQGYNNLQFVIRDWYASSAGKTTLRINNDSTANVYAVIQQAGLGFTSTSSAETETSILNSSTHNASATDQRNAYVVTFYDYTNTTANKLGITSNSFLHSGSAAIAVANGMFSYNPATAAAITRLDFGLTVGNFSGGTYILYGVK